MLCVIYYDGKSVTSRGAVVHEWRIFPEDVAQLSYCELRHFPYTLRRYSRGEYYLYTSGGVSMGRVHVTEQRAVTVTPSITGDVSRTPGFTYILL